MADSTTGSRRNPSPRAAGYDEGAFVHGYLAALDDLGGGHTSERCTEIWRNCEAAARRAYDDPGWLDRIDLHARALARLPERTPRPERPGYVYVLLDAARQLYKIGWSTNVEARHRSIEHATGASLSLVAVRPGTMRDEKRLHEGMAAFRERGEWFRPNDVLVGWLR